MERLTACIALLHQQFPHTHIVDDQTSLRSYAVDNQVPGLLIRPSTIEETSRIIKIIDQYQLKVLPRGNGIQINQGDQSQTIDILLETTALNRLLEHEASDLTCHVEAGITLGQLQDLLATKGQRLALDPPNAESITVGGLLATNASGPKRLRYGSARDLVIGLHVIRADGEVTSSGGRVVKNVAGYDLNKLYIGSLGTLGIIIEANFKLHPIPQKEQTLLFTFTNCEDAMQTAIDLVRSPLSPSAIELITRRERASSPFLLALPDNGYSLAVDFENSTIAITRQINETLKIANAHRAFLKNDLEGSEQKQFWQTIRQQMQGTLTCKICLPVSRIAAYIHELENICQEQQLNATIIAHAGNGILYVELSPHNQEKQVVTAIAELRQLAQNFKGNLVVECCPTQVKPHLSVWGEPRSDFFLMQRIKQQFDPHGLFVSGRYIGGL
jgi:glycolate oxidase FAD binding subunit